MEENTSLSESSFELLIQQIWGRRKGGEDLLDTL
jgi:hypothetical protein